MVHFPPYLLPSSNTNKWKKRFLQKSSLILYIFTLLFLLQLLCMLLQLLHSFIFFSFPKEKLKHSFFFSFFFIKKFNIVAQNAHSKNAYFNNSNNNNLRILYEYTKKNSRYKNDYNLFYTFQQHIPLNFTVVYFSTITCYYINTMVYGIYYSALKIRKKVVE